MINLTINGKEVSVEPGTSILDACKKLNIKIPTQIPQEAQAGKSSL